MRWRKEQGKKENKDGLSGRDETDVSARCGGDVEPEEWEKWWNSNKARLEEALTRGDRARMMPALWSANYYWMAKAQSGVAYYFHAQGRPVKTSGYYEEKAKEEENCNRQKVLEAYHRDTAFARRL